MTEIPNNPSAPSNTNNININNDNNNPDISIYTTQNGSKINLSGKDLTTEEGEKLLQLLFTNYSNATDIDLSNCNLETLPKILFNFRKLSTFDIVNNKFSNFEQLVQSLTKFTNLTDLKLDLVDQNQVLMILSQLPKLIFLNGKNTKAAVTIVDVDEKDIEDISLQNDLDSYNDLVNKINERESDQTFVTVFQNKLFDEAEKVKNCLNNNEPNYIYANVVIESQLNLEKHLAEKFLQYLEGENKEIATTLFNLLFKNIERLISLINILYPKIENKISTLRNQLEEAWKSADEAVDFENELNQTKKMKDILSNDNNLIKMKLSKLESENKILIEKLLNASKSNFNNTNTDSLRNITKSENKNNNNNTLNNAINESKIVNESPNFTGNIEIETTTNLNKAKSNPILNNITNKLNNNYGPNLTKVLTIKMTKDIMNEIYNSKASYDKKCFNCKLPKETLEQHMYTYLNQKYGLKNLTIEWASSIINAIKLYSNEDSDINLFGKILRNEQEEDSRFLLENIKKNISDILEYYLKSKSPFKRQKEIKNSLQNKKDGILYEEEWKGIVSFLYNEEDSKILQEKITNYISKQNEKIALSLNEFEQTGIVPTNIINNNTTNNTNITTFSNNNINNIGGYYLTSVSGGKKLTREDLFNLNKMNQGMNILYKDFVRLLCNYQIKMRDKYLKNFLKLFRKFDTDNDGILNESEFVNLIKEIPYCQKNLEDNIYKFLTTIDPFNNKKITFSEVISLFGMENIDEENDNENKVENIKKVDEKNIENNNNENSNKKGKNNNKYSLLDKICLGEPFC